LRLPVLTAIFRLRADSGTASEPMSFWSNAATLPDFAALTRPRSADESEVRRGFWKKLRRLASHLPFAEDLVAAHYCAFDRQTPLKVKAALIGALAYFVMPADMIPDVLPVIGYTDDAAVIAAAIRLVSSHITADHRDAARLTLARLRGRQ
jgi:uncharacterized membrane protein YkvA (DUF1232 family)